MPAPEAQPDKAFRARSVPRGELTRPETLFFSPTATAPISQRQSKYVLLMAKGILPNKCEW